LNDSRGLEQGFTLTAPPEEHLQTHVTGYNVYRTSNPSIPRASWPTVATDVVDMDPTPPNKQWVDTSGNVPPGGIWYYQITAYNAWCPAEGPF